MTTAAAKQTLLVTADELTEIADWERKYAKAKKAASDAEKEVKFRRLALAEKVLGIKTEDELKALTPDQVQKRFSKRLESGDWRPERGAPEFSFTKSSEGRYPAWAQLFASELGETAAARIKTETPVVYSYAVEVSTQ
jgi:hypothetical protein